jgi:hypothetical protein
MSVATNTERGAAGELAIRGFLIPCNQTPRLAVSPDESTVVDWSFESCNSRQVRHSNVRDVELQKLPVPVGSGSTLVHSLRIRGSEK